MGYFSSSHNKSINFKLSVEQNHFKAKMELAKFQGLKCLLAFCVVYVRQGYMEKDHSRKHNSALVHCLLFSNSTFTAEISVSLEIYQDISVQF